MDAKDAILDQPVQYIKGVGPKRAQLLQRLGLRTVHDLLGYYPREYDDRRKVSRIGTLFNGQKATVRGRVEAADVKPLNASLSLFKAAINDGTGIVFAQFFRKVNRYHQHDIFGSLREHFQRGKEVILSGTCEINFSEKQLKVEEYEVITGNEAALQAFQRIVPVYPLTEGITQKWLREILRETVTKYAECWPETLPGALREEQKLVPAAEAVRQIHLPDDFARAEAARRRLAFDEFLLLETALTIARRKSAVEQKPFSYEIKRTILSPFKERLRFEFTHAQKKVINEIFSDMQSKRQMNRLLMGDVGSGKTIVALSAILLAIENGFQAALLAPTEILAEQHAITIHRFLEGLPVRAALLTNKVSTKKKERQHLLDALQAGEIDLLIGTHAILEEDIRFKSLSLVVIDEQHRFGVLQRAALQKKGAHPDVLVMTATPIPRSLALTIYGDMDVSVIDQLPPGRQPIETLHLTEPAAYDLVKREIAKGHQAYIVYPLVEESDKLELKAAVTEAETLSQSVFKGFRVGLLHGQMRADEKEKVMTSFRAGEFDLLIATTVIEVGIDVPNATVMVIEHAERFGLAALHQLRGRIGRGKDKSYCVLLASPKSDDAKKRLHVMLSTTDGFKIAEEDLEIRGPGEMFGTAQSGLLLLKAGNLITDGRIIESAKKAAAGIAAKDPGLSWPEHAALHVAIRRAYRDRLNLLRIG